MKVQAIPFLENGNGMLADTIESGFRREVFDDEHCSLVFSGNPCCRYYHPRSSDRADIQWMEFERDAESHRAWDNHNRAQIMRHQIEGTSPGIVDPPKPPTTNTEKP